MINRKKKKEATQSVGKKSILPGAILMALIVAIVLYFVMISAERNALADYEKDTVYITQEAVPQNVVITEENAPTYFKTAALDKNIIPANAITDLESLYHMAPIFAMDTGMAITTNMFRNIDEIAAAMEDPKMIGIALDGYDRTVNGTIRPGDTVDIYIIMPEDRNADTVSVERTDVDDSEPAYAEVYVQEAFDGSGVSILNGDTTSICQNINVLFETADIEAFYTAVAEGTVYIVKHVN